jgi:hypothetical protein
MLTNESLGAMVSFAPCLQVFGTINYCVFGVTALCCGPRNDCHPACLFVCYTVDEAEKAEQDERNRMREKPPRTQSKSCQCTKTMRAVHIADPAVVCRVQAGSSAAPWMCGCTSHMQTVWLPMLLV